MAFSKGIFPLKGSLDSLECLEDGQVLLVSTFLAKFTTTSRHRTAVMLASWPSSQWISTARAQIAMKTHRIAKMISAMHIALHKSLVLVPSKVGCKRTSHCTHDLANLALIPWWGFRLLKRISTPPTDTLLTPPCPPNPPPHFTPLCMLN